MFWLIIGIVLFLWVVYDLISGKVWSFTRIIYRSDEPGSYWFVLLIYFALAIMCITPYFMWY